MGTNTSTHHTSPRPRSQVDGHAASVRGLAHHLQADALIFELEEELHIVGSDVARVGLRVALDVRRGLCADLVQGRQARAEDLLQVANGHEQEAGRHELDLAVVDQSPVDGLAGGSVWRPSLT